VIARDREGLYRLLGEKRGDAFGGKRRLPSHHLQGRKSHKCGKGEKEDRFRDRGEKSISSEEGWS